MHETYLQISDDLTDAQEQAVAEASAEDVSVPTFQATRDVQLVAQLTQSASRQMPLFLAAQLAELAAPGTMEDLDMLWLPAWQDYTDTQGRMEELSEPALLDAWHEVRDSAVTSQVDGVLAARAGAADPPPLPLLQLIGLVGQNLERDALLTGLLDEAVGTAQSLAAEDRAQASQRRLTTLVLGLTLLAAVATGAFLLGRRVSRSLGVLARQATEISEGSLVEVDVSGPREVRTVSTALDAAVAGLRRIQDQAQAVARGDLDDALLEQPLPGPLGEVVHASVREIVNSVRQREELRDALAHQATHDPLTELPNRAQARALVTAALHRARRSGAMTGLLFLDLDGFKSVNDSNGHATGDAVLRDVAQRLRDAVRPGDVVCRHGGDEFIVLVESVTSERHLVELAERLIASICEPITVDGCTVRIGASVGLTVSRDGGVDAEALFAEADTAAYRAKGKGRGRAEVFDEALRGELQARAELETAIAHAIQHHELELHYQPVVDVATGRIHGYEALVRWNRPDHGMVPPDQFVPVAEGSQLICDLDRWVLREATRQLAVWLGDDSAGGITEPTVAVNISGRHLADLRVVDDVVSALADSGLPAHLLVIEVTETVLVNDPAAMDHLAELRELGVAVAIDDFGTGYTSIGQLGTMPVDTLKIDRSFIASPEPGARELVALMIRAAHTFGLTVVAEGVEDADQLERLRSQSCDLAQGYLLHRPMPSSEAGALLRSVDVVTGVS
jgi:diguanylate cyclase (GGDEF)-like protein